jgi:murein DD-endopeptidase MepM/ murein hydrolase activator NlpD
MICCPLPGKPFESFRVTQKFGENPEYYKKYGHRGHNGYDLAPFIPGKVGVELFAPHDGYVKITDQKDVGYGLYVRITSDPMGPDRSRRCSDLAHLASVSPALKQGMFVNMGDLIGIMGTSGDSTGIHTHWTFKKLDAGEKTINSANGFNGAIDVWQHVRFWYP